MPTKSKKASLKPWWRITSSRIGRPKFCKALMVPCDECTDSIASCIHVVETRPYLAPICPIHGAQWGAGSAEQEAAELLLEQVHIIHCGSARTDYLGIR